jgi:hypothetical protein
MLLTLLQVPSAAAQCSPYDGNPPLEEEEEEKKYAVRQDTN